MVGRYVDATTTRRSSRAADESVRLTTGYLDGPPW